MSALFCDVDETIIRGKSLLAFAEELAAVTPRRADDVRRALRTVHEMLDAGRPRADVNRTYYELVLRDRDCDEVAMAADRWFARASASPRFFRAEVCAFLERCRRTGSSIILVSGSFPRLLAPIARHVRAQDVIGTTPERLGSAYTGRVLGAPVIGEGKADRVRAYARARGLSLEDCLGIGDDMSDVAFLRLVGSARVPSSAAPAMLRHAHDAGWGILAESGE